MNKKTRTSSHKYSLVSVLLLVGTSVQAADIYPILAAGIDAGGETLVEVTFTDGSRQTIDANAGLFFSAGLGFPNTQDGSVDTQLSLGWKIDNITAKNADAEFSTVFLDLIEAWHFDSISLGLGITHQFGPKVTASGPGLPVPINAKFDDATGFVVQAGYRWEDVMIGLRYTNIEYSHANLTRKVDGSCAGIFLSASLGKTRKTAP